MKSPLAGLVLMAMSAALGLAACKAIDYKYQEDLDSWLGHSESELVRTLGAPHRVYETQQNERILTWVKARQESLPSMSDGTYDPLTGMYSGPTLHPTGGAILNLLCETTFTVLNGRVVGASHSGNDCTWFQRAK